MFGLHLTYIFTLFCLFLFGIAFFSTDYFLPKFLTWKSTKLYNQSKIYLDESIDNAGGLLDEGERKNKGGFLSKLVSVGFKKKEQADETPMIDSNYSNIELNSNTEIDDNLGIKEPDIETVKSDMIEAHQNAEKLSDDLSTSESDLTEEKSFDLNYDTEEVSDDVNAPTDNEIQDSLLDIEVDANKEDDLIDNTIDDDSSDPDGELELPSFLKRQAN